MSDYNLGANHVREAADKKPSLLGQLEATKKTIAQTDRPQMARKEQAEL